MIDIAEITRQLAASGEAVRALVQPLTVDQARWTPDPERWSIAEVVAHLYNEERIDFRQHLQEMLSDPPLPWGALRREGWIAVESCRQALDRFLQERDASIAWLDALNAPDWDVASQASFGPDDETLTLRAGDVLISWVDHDLLHLRQIVALLHGWHEAQGASYSTRYAGGRW
jgi:uncharacterized damage-inducible protein DinB